MSGRIHRLADTRREHQPARNFDQRSRHVLAVDFDHHTRIPVKSAVNLGVSLDIILAGVQRTRDRKYLFIPHVSGLINYLEFDD